MREMQTQIIRALNVTAEIDPAAEVKKRVSFLIEYLNHSAASGFVLGISGGQDSSLAGRLCQLAIERIMAEGSTADFFAMRLPYATQHDEDDAQLALSFIQPKQTVTFDIRRAVDGFQIEYGDAFQEDMTDFNKGNVKARARMIAQYALAGQHGLRVVGTDHAAEAVTGFYTKFGDGGADLVPLAGLTKRQGRLILQFLGAPERLYLKVPTADLLDEIPGQTDEANLGIRYDDIDNYLEGRAVPDEVAESIESRYRMTEHKRRSPATVFDQWWR